MEGGRGAACTSTCGRQGYPRAPERDPQRGVEVEIDGCVGTSFDPAGSGSPRRRDRDCRTANRAGLIADDTERALDREASGRVTPEGWQVVFQRLVAGVPVADDRYSFVIGHGNLVSFGASRWARIDVSTIPSIAPAESLRRLYAYMGLTGTEGIDLLGAAELRLLPIAAPGTAGPFDGTLGAGYASALPWRWVLRVAGEPGTWVGQVDAHDGRILSFEDDDRYALVKGGVYPVSDDQLCPDGCEQANYPMPFADLTI